MLFGLNDAEFCFHTFDFKLLFNELKIRTYFQTGNFLINFFLIIYYIIFLATKLINMKRGKDSLDLISMTEEELKAFLTVNNTK
jgi:large-conductance mechanosensitive channel